MKRSSRANVLTKYLPGKAHCRRRSRSARAACESDLAGQVFGARRTLPRVALAAARTKPCERPQQQQQQPSHELCARSAGPQRNERQQVLSHAYANDADNGRTCRARAPPKRPSRFVSNWPGRKWTQSHTKRLGPPRTPGGHTRTDSATGKRHFLNCHSPAVRQCARLKSANCVHARLAQHDGALTSRKIHERARVCQRACRAAHLRAERARVKRALGQSGPQFAHSFIRRGSSASWRDARGRPAGPVARERRRSCVCVCVCVRYGAGGGRAGACAPLRRAVE